jgi:hypothetical protein
MEGDKLAKVSGKRFSQFTFLCSDLALSFNG